MSELRACPFCGSNADVSSVMADVILCSNVNCYFYSHYVSIRTWNTRPLEDALSARIQAIIHEVQKYQPTGSPPPGDEVMLTRWIMSTLSAENAKLVARIAALEAAGDGLVTNNIYPIYRGNSDEILFYQCQPCGHEAKNQSEIDHSPDCPVEKWKAIR